MSINPDSTRTPGAASANIQGYLDIPGQAARRRLRRPLLVVPLAAVVAVALVATSILGSGQPSAKPAWVGLPDPLAFNLQRITTSVHGQVLAAGGGQGNGTLTLTTGEPVSAAALLDIVCQGTGDLTIAGLGQVGCYDGNVNAYEITHPADGLPIPRTVPVTAAAGLSWRLTISADNT